MSSILERYSGLTSDKVAELRSFGQSMSILHFTADQVENMIKWKLSGDEVYINRYYSIEPDHNENRKQLERMFLESEGDIEDEGYRIVQPLQREFAYHRQGDSIGVTVIAVRCRIKQKKKNLNTTTTR